MAKYYPINTCYALLVQAVISRAIMDGYDIGSSSGYKKLYGPLLEVHNEMYVNHTVTDPVAASMGNINDTITMKYVYQRVDSYFMHLLNIMSEMGIAYNVTDVFMTACRNKWVTRGGHMDKPTELLAHYTGKRWKKEVISSDTCPREAPANSYIIRKRYTGHTGTEYLRIRDTVLSNHYKCTYIVFSIKED